MDMDEAAVFLAGSVLTSIGFLVILGAVLVANNLIAKYWKSWGWTFMQWMHHQEPTRFMTEEEAKAMNHAQEETSKKV